MGNSVSSLKPKKRVKGTVIIIYWHGKRLYVASDSRLTYEYTDPITNETFYTIVYGSSNEVGLRLKIELTGEKIFMCDGFTIALAGDYDIAHLLCTSLRDTWTKDVTHDSLVQTLLAHSHSEVDHRETFFAVVTPTENDDFSITHVTPKNGSYSISGSGPFFCFGSGEEVAQDFMSDYLNQTPPNSDTEVVEMLQKAVYHVSAVEKTKTVGGTVVVTVSEVENCDVLGKKLLTKIFRFPSVKPWWPIGILEDGIHIPEASFMSVEESLKEVLDFATIKKIKNGQLTKEAWTREDRVTVRVYSDVLTSCTTFYQTSDYMSRKDYNEHQLILSYNKDLLEFKMSLESDENLSDDTCRELIDKETIMFWDNGDNVFVVCLV